ncbi:MAG: 2-oxoacid:ferredoxin oxidoreductase subunit beta [Deltaproteobacteria bacterium]|nr:2-oxoacid:ferredoxin oxidoreductase subunit beta [Deltaproteobacteria bacterium]
MSFDYTKYLRTEHLPHLWCPGCTHGIVMKSFLRVVDSLGLNQDETVVVSGIGCASRLPGYVDFCTLHTTHGRALPFATGIKLARPELTVVVVSGDGDALAIGGNHFIHACRRNIDLTLIIFNNSVYGMTGGQYSPTTDHGMFSSTTPYGNPDHAFDAGALAMAAGATFVARTTAYHVRQMDKLIGQAVQHSGFSVVEVLEACYTNFGRRNKQLFKSNMDMLMDLKKKAVPVEKARKLAPKEMEGKYETGLLYEVGRPGYIECCDDMIGRKQEG